MIAAARSRFSAYRFDGGTALFACGVSLPLVLFPFLYELRKTVRNAISHSLLSNVLGLLVPHSLRSSRLVVSWGISCRIVIGVIARGGCRFLRFCSLASRCGGGIIRLSCGVAVCLSSSFACRLVCFSSFRLDPRLVARSPCPSSLGGVACLLIPSCPFFSCRRAWRPFSSLGVSRGVSSSMICPLRWRGVLAVPVVSSRLIVSESEEVLASHFISAASGWAALLVLPSRWLVIACFWFRREMGQCRSRHRRSSACFLSSYGCGAWGLCGVLIWLVVACFLSSAASLLPRVAHSIGDGREGRRRGDCLLGYRHMAHRVSSMGVYNKYDVCDVYKRYKDTMIREYDGYMR